MSINFGFEASVKNGRSSRAAGRLEQFEGTNESIIPLPPPGLFHLGGELLAFLSAYTTDCHHALKNSIYSRYILFEFESTKMIQRT